MSITCQLGCVPGVGSSTSIPPAYKRLEAITPEDLLQVLEPFFTTNPAGKGTGLGLAICRRVVQEHHGTLRLTSTVGVGTTVHIVLPVENATHNASLHETAS
jgi:signal transduction histidine kinase